jgi:hypothetical protein
MMPRLGIGRRESGCIEAQSKVDYPSSTRASRELRRGVMHRAIQRQGVVTFLRQEAPFLFAALILAEMFYKFGSFALECLAFLVTWYALSFVATRIAAAWSGGREPRRMDSPDA